MSAGDEERRKGRHGGRVFEHRREEMSLHVVHADQRERRARTRTPCRTLTPTSSAPTSPGALVTATASMSSSSTRHRRAPARRRDDRGQVRARRDLGDHAAEYAVDVLRQDHERVELRRRRRIPREPPPTSRRTTSRCRGFASLVRRGAGAGDGHRSHEMTFTCDGFTRSVPNPVVSTSTRCGNESGKVMTARIVCTVFTCATRNARSGHHALRIESRRDRTGDDSVRATTSAERIGTLRCASTRSAA